jgi:hypothetical protein
LADEGAGGLDGVGGLGEEGPEQVEGVCVNREELQSCVDPVFARPGGECLGIG